MKNILLTTAISFVLISCSIKDNVKLSGIINLSEKEKILKVNQSNKNDVTNLLGESIFFEFTAKDTWIYGEIISKKNFFGSTKIIESNLLYLNFNNRGVLVKKKMLDKENLKDIDFSETYTASNSLNRSFSKKLLNSMRKRYEKKIRKN